MKEWLDANKLPAVLADSVLNPLAPILPNRTASLTEKQYKEFKRQRERIFNRSLDECHGECPLRNPALARIVGDAILRFAGERYDLDRFVIMPNHVHAIVQFRSGFALKTVNQSWMRYTARAINQYLNRRGAFWQPEPFDHIIRSSEQFKYLGAYIEANPQKAKLRKGEYLYWKHE